MTRASTALLILVGTLFCGCKNVDDPVVNVNADDKKMNEAMETARKTFPKFVANWETMECESQSVKIAVPTSGGGVEHIWFEPTKITATEVTGVCGNDPRNVPGLKLGDRKTYELSQVSDWMIMADGKCYGGYTIRVLIEMTPGEAPEMEFAEL
ncbi:MAG: DUF2314 domain-containing protein [Planctomycetota bacterium]